MSLTSRAVHSSSVAISSGRRLAAELLDELALHVHDLVQLLHHVHGDPDGAGLVGDRAGHGLADPPGGVGRELVAAPVVELLDGADQAERALLDQVEEREATAEVALGDRDHEAQVGLDHLLLRDHVAALDALGEPDLLVRGEQVDPPDRAEVEAQGVEARLDGQVDLGLLRPAGPPAGGGSPCRRVPSARRSRCPRRGGAGAGPGPAPWSPRPPRGTPRSPRRSGTRAPCPRGRGAAAPRPPRSGALSLSSNEQATPSCFSLNPYAPSTVAAPPSRGHFRRALGCWAFAARAARG